MVLSQSDRTVHYQMGFDCNRKFHFVPKTVHRHGHVSSLTQKGTFDRSFENAIMFKLVCELPYIKNSDLTRRQSQGP